MTDPLPAARFGPGWHDEERDDLFAFRWMAREATLTLPPGGPFLAFYAFSEFLDASQTLTVRSGEATVAELPLLHQWTPYSVELPPGATGVAFALNKRFPRKYYPKDPRELGIRVAEIRRHGDADQHADAAAFLANAVLNVRESIAKSEAPRSRPLSLGIDLHGRCNMVPPCVYCQWDANKDSEGPLVDTVVDEAALEGYGAFFGAARTLVNCSIGEPLLHPRLKEVLDLLERRGKFLEMSTNGLSLTARAADLLAGRKVFLYVSLDAGTAATYARIRNDRFETIVAQLRALSALRSQRGGWPKLYMVFMPMQVNKGDLEAYFRLCRDLMADAVVLRPLNVVEERQPVVTRAGYAFEYHKEHLTPDEQREVFLEAQRWSRETGVPVLNQFYFGALPAKDEAAAPEAEEPPPAPDPDESPDLGHGRLPLCREPWQNYYILRRGIMPCCYGHAPIASMEEYETAWNGPVLREIRENLAAGRFSRYCLESLSCPIVRRHALRRDPASGEVRQPAWLRAAKVVNRAAFGVPGWIWRGLRGMRS
jgi:MoaA/NifB/PqqE/SkfB family radical SAM enzyme